MSSGQGDIGPAKADDDTEIKPSEEADKMASEDQVDHASEASLAHPLQQLISEDSSNKTDSGFKDNLSEPILADLTDKTKSNSENTDDNSDDDLELKWEDDETDEQNITAIQVTQEAAKTAPENAKPTEASVDDSNLSSIDPTDEKMEDVDENKLLESSPSNNEDTNLSSISDIAKTNVPLNKTDENESNLGDDVIDENQLLEGPESDAVDEEKLLEISDENKDSSLSKVDLVEIESNSIKTNIGQSENVTLSDKPKDISTTEKESKTNIKDETNLDSKTTITKEIQSNKKLQSAKSDNGATAPKNISNLESTSPIHDNSQVLFPSTPNDSLMDTTLNINTEHGLNKPDMMLEIPTQEVIELMDDTDLSVSGTFNENVDDKMEVDSDNDNPTKDSDVAIDVEKSIVEEKTDAIVLKPADVFRSLDIQKPKVGNETNKTRDVSEDDWCEIERRLEGFEDSMNEGSELDEQIKTTSHVKDDITQIEEDISSNKNQSENTETIPLTNAQKKIIESENKQLLKTLLDTSKLDATEDEITAMDVDEEMPTPGIKHSTEFHSESTQDANKDDVTPEIDLQCDLGKTEKPPNTEKDLEAVSDIVKIQESINPAIEIDKNDSKPMSLLKSPEEINIQEEPTEQFKTSTTIESTTDLAAHSKEKTIETPEIPIDKSTELSDKVEALEIKPSEQAEKVVPLVESMEVQASTKETVNEGTSTTIATEQITDVEHSKSKPIEDEDIPTSPVGQLASKSIDDAKVISSTANDTVNVAKPKIAVEPLPSTANPESKVPSSKSIDIEIEPSKPPMEIETSTNTIQEDDIPAFKCDGDIPSASKVPDSIEVQPPTSDVPSSIEEPSSTSKIPDSDVVSTCKLPKTIEVETTISNAPNNTELQSVLDTIDVESTTSKSPENTEVETTTKIPDNIEVSPTTSKVPDGVELQLSTLKDPDSIKPESSPSKVSDNSEIQAETSKVSDNSEVLSTISKVSDKIEVQSTISKVADKVEVQLRSEALDDDKVQLLTTKNLDSIEVQLSTSKASNNTEISPPTTKIADDIEVHPLTSKVFDKTDVSLPTSKAVDSIKVQPSILKNLDSIEHQLSTSKASDNTEISPPTTKIANNIKVQPSTSKVSDKTEVSPPTSKVVDNTEVQHSTSKNLDSIEVQPSTSQVSDNSEVSSQTSKAIEDIEIQPSTTKNLDGIEAQPSSSKVPDETKISPSTSKAVEDIQIQPSTSKNVDNIEDQPSTSKVPDSTEISPSTSKPVDNIEVPSTSKVPDTIEESLTATITLAAESTADPDSADDGPENLDSLGLLAESSRVMEDDEEQDDDDDGDADGDDDDDYDPEDESSNQMTAEHSEDSNAPHSETDQPKEIDIESPLAEKGEDEFRFTVDAVVDKDEAMSDDKDASMDVDEDTVQDDIEVTPEQVGNEIISDDVQPMEDTIVGTEEAVKDKAKQTDSETAKHTDKTESDSMLKQMLAKKEDQPKASEAKSSPSKKLGFAQPSHVVNIVDLEESSSEDDIQEVKKEAKGTLVKVDGYKITIPSSVAVSSVPVEPPGGASEGPAGAGDKGGHVETGDEAAKDKPKPKFSLEIFSLDSDEEDTSAPATAKQEDAAIDIDKARESNKCINISCTSAGNVQYYPADLTTLAYYDAGKRKKALVCQVCAESVVKRTERLVNGLKDLTPLLDLDTCKLASDVLEISDSESEEETDTTDEPKETLGETGASFLEANLAKMLNETWTKFRLDSRLAEAQDELNLEMQKLEEESKEINAMLTECQVATDKLRNDLYATFEQQRREIGAIVIHDTPISKYSCQEKEVVQNETTPETRAKRRMSSAAETPAKRPAIPLGYAPLDSDTAQVQNNKQPTVETTKAEDDKDISVMKVSAEAAPPELPPPGELNRPPLRAGMCVYAMRNAFGCWLRSRVLEVNGKSAVVGMTQSFTVCRVKYEHKPKGSTKLSPARCLAYSEPAPVRLTIGTRIIALFKDSQNPLKKDAFYSGIISEVPNPVNNYRYLVFFDDGYAQYVQHRDTRVVCESSSLVWEEVHPVSREFVREYLLAYPERPMVRLHAGQSLKTEWNGKWWVSRVVQVDASLVQVHFEEDNRTEWIYRGSTRLAPLFLELQAAGRHRGRPMPRTKAQPRINMPYVEYTRSDEQSSKAETPSPQAPAISDREIRQRAVAKKSTALPPAPNIPPPPVDSVTSRVVYYTPKNAVKPYKMTVHNCGPHCKRKDVLALKDLRTYNPLAKPLLSGWERQVVRYKGHKEVMYRAPCGRRLRSMRELHRYLRAVQSDMAVDLFDFTPHTHCLAEFVLNKCLVGKKDLSHGKENVPVPCVNYYDESLPEFCSYNTERTPTAGVPLNLDPEFLCGCDCTDDCEDKSKCACWQMTLEGARTIGLGGPNVGYKYKRLPEPLPSGIYECNSRCKCKHTCLNRVAQHPLQLKLQVFKTLNRGWGIRALNDIPKGSFLCVYAGNLLTDATANMDGLNEGDEYLAELDYIEVVEQMKEGYEEDIPAADKRLDKKNSGNAASDESEMSSSEEEDGTPSKNEQEDGDFCPGFIGMGVSEFSKRLRKRDKSKKKGKADSAAKEKEKDEKTGDDCITISDDEEVREPSRFMAQAGMGKEFISKYRSVRSYFGKDEACYIMDAKVQGNIGRYLNHSCQPNVFVQNVFVDTHDPRFPWVAFFALSHIKAGTELTWNYNYDVGSVPGKVLYCYCGAPNCRGRLL